MKITPIRDIDFCARKKETSRKSHFFNRLFNKNSDTVEIKGPISHLKELYDMESNEEFNNYLAKSDKEKMAKQIFELNQKFGVLPTTKMNTENMLRLLDDSDYEKVKKFALMQDRHKANIFQRGDVEKIDLICSKLKQNDISLGIFARNCLGSNAFHTSMNSPEKIESFCTYLSQDDIKYGASTINSSNKSPFMSFPIESFEMLLDFLSTEDIEELAQSCQINKKNCLYFFDSEKLDTICRELRPTILYNLLSQQDEEGNTVFHIQNPENINTICKHLDKDSIEKLMKIENSRKETPEMTLEIE